MVAEVHPHVTKMVCQKEKQTIGVIGSLAKKGMVECDTDEGVEWIRITDAGLEMLN